MLVVTLGLTGCSCAGFWTPEQLGGGVQFSSGNYNTEGQNAQTVLVTVNAISGANDTRVSCTLMPAHSCSNGNMLCLESLQPWGCSSCKLELMPEYVC